MVFRLATDLPRAEARICLRFKWFPLKPGAYKIVLRRVINPCLGGFQLVEGWAHLVERVQFFVVFNFQHKRRSVGRGFQ